MIRKLFRLVTYFVMAVVAYSAAKVFYRRYNEKNNASDAQVDEPKAITGNE